MRKLLVYMKDYKKESFLAPLFKLLEATFELIVPLVIAQIIDVGIQTGDTGFIISRCLLLVGFGVVGMISAITAQYFAAKAAAGKSVTAMQRISNRDNMRFFIDFPPYVLCLKYLYKARLAAGQILSAVQLLPAVPAQPHLCAPVRE